MKSSQNHPGQSYFLSSFSKNTRLKRSVHESVCELLNAGFTAEHMENYKSVQKDRMLAHALQWPQDHLWWWIKLWSPLYMNSSAAWVSVFLICKMGMKWNNVCKGSSSVPSIQQTLKKYDYFLHLDSVLLHRALRGNRMKQEGRQKQWWVRGCSRVTPCYSEIMVTSFSKTHSPFLQDLLYNELHLGSKPCDKTRASIILIVRLRGSGRC